jgi:hypothetical protein
VTITGVSQQAFTAQAAVMPPVVASSCTTPATFTYTGTITASAPGKVSYRWVYSTGRQGPVQTVTFTAAGQRRVPGQVIKTRTAGGGWAAIKLVSPAAPLSKKVSYRLLCGPAHNSDGITVTASVRPAAETVTCGTAPPAFTATGSITSHKAVTVTYYWALSDGQNSPPATLVFAAPGTMAVQPLTVTPQGDSATGEAVLVVTSPVVAASSPATFTLSCTPPPPGRASAFAQVSPATDTVSCSAAPPAFTFTGTITVGQAATVSYHWQLPNGTGPDQTLHFAQPGTQPVTPVAFTPGSDRYSGSGSIIVTSPGTTVSNAASFTLSCGQGKPPLVISPAGQLPSGQQGTPYTATVTATGGDGNYTWAAVSGLPAGLSARDPGGTLTISGTPQQVGIFPVGVSVSDGESPQQTAQASLTLVITTTVQTLSISPVGQLPAGQQGTPYSASVTATGGDGNYTWAAVSGLPPGLSDSTNGGTLTISGTPQEKGTFPVGVSVSDGESPPQTAQASLTLDITAAPVQTLSISPDGGPLPAGQQGTPYSASVAATGGDGNYTWGAVSGLPLGLSDSTNGGTLTISGVTKEKGTFTVGVSVSDGESPPQTAQASFTLDITAPVQTLSISPAGGPLPSGQQGAPYSTSVTATGGDGNYTWGAVSGLPLGLSDSTNGGTLTISGTTQQSGTFTVGVSVSDGESTPQTQQASYTLDITPTRVAPLVLNPADGGSLPSGTADAQYSATVTVSGGDGNYTWGAVSGLPEGLSDNAAGNTLTISGMTSQVDTFTVGVSVSDGESTPQTAQASYTLDITTQSFSPVVLTPAGGSLPAGQLGASYSTSITASGGDGNYTWGQVSGLPQGLTDSTNGGTLTISGTPTFADTFTVGVSVSDGESSPQMAQASFTLDIGTGSGSSPALVISPAGGPLPSGQQNVAYSTSAMASGGDGTTRGLCRGCRPG